MPNPTKSELQCLAETAHRHLLDLVAASQQVKGSLHAPEFTEGVVSPHSFPLVKSVHALHGAVLMATSHSIQMLQAAETGIPQHLGHVASRLQSIAAYVKALAGRALDLGAILEPTHAAASVMLAVKETLNVATIWEERLLAMIEVLKKAADKQLI